jgi:segregation and condensation protein A
LEQIDLDSVGDFIYMSAQLINIKARMLLPRPEVDEEGEPVDPRRELVNRLLTYMKYKEAAESLTDRYAKRSEYFTRNFPEQEKEEIVGRQGVELQVSVFSLISALQRVLSEAPDVPTHAVHRNQYSVESQRQFILEHLALQDRVSFTRLIRHRPKHFIIVTFLVLLEMTQQGQIALMVSPDGDDFFLERKIDYGEVTNGLTNGAHGVA